MSYKNSQELSIARVDFFLSFCYMNGKIFKFENEREKAQIFQFSMLIVFDEFATFAKKFKIKYSIYNFISNHGSIVSN